MPFFDSEKYVEMFYTIINYAFIGIRSYYIILLFNYIIIFILYVPKY